MAKETIEEQAAQWFTRLQAANLPVEEILEWHRWMATDVRHTQVFRQVEEVWLQFAELPRPPLLTREAVGRDHYTGQVSVRQWNGQLRTTNRRRALFWALAASISVVAIDLLMPSIQALRSTEILQTSVGEYRTVTLADGSRLALGGDTRVRVRLGAERRVLLLDAGEALFSVAKDPSRPFEVHAGNATVTAVGTQFDVRRNSDRVTISVLEGRVRIQRVPEQVPVWLGETIPGLSAGRPVLLDAGGRTAINAGGSQTTVSDADAAAVTAWQRGRLSFDDEPLRYAVEAVNRYSRQPIVITDPRIADVRVSGTFVVDHVNGWVASLRTGLGIRSVDDGHQIRLERSE